MTGLSIYIYLSIQAKIAESEGRLLCSKCQGDMLPNKDGVYEFENFRPGIHLLNLFYSRFCQVKLSVSRFRHNGNIK